MLISTPASFEEAVAELAAEPGSVPLGGGTDLMVGINFGRERPQRVLSLRRLGELREVSSGARVRCGAGVTYSRLLAELTDPAVVQAARTVGSLQIRNAGTVGGNLGTCSPAGDLLPALAALEATVILAGPGGERRVPFAGWMQGPKRPNRRPDELVVAAEWDAAGPDQAFLKAGTRNAMVISVANLALVVDRGRRRVGLALGSVGPVVIRAEAAERFAEGLLEEAGWERRIQPTPAALEEFGRLAAAAAEPIDDVRGTLAYRRHVLAVMARRGLERTCS